MKSTYTEEKRVQNTKKKVQISNGINTNTEVKYISPKVRTNMEERERQRE